MHRIDIVVYPGFKMLEAISTLTVFSYANHHLRESGGSGGYDVRIAAPVPGLVRSDTPVPLEATEPLDTQRFASTVIIVGARNIEAALEESREIVRWLERIAHRVKRIAALCSATLFLAASGFLDGKRATTHWSVTALLAGRYPKVRVGPDAIFLQEGTVWTSAGVSAAIDLALAFVEHDHGRDLALKIARDMVIYLKRPSGQAQVSASLQSQMTQSPTVREMQAWILDHLQDRLSVDELAARFAMSTRHFSRMFQRETGASPTVYIELARLERAKRLLEDTRLPMKSLAFRSGFPSDARMRSAFRKYLGTTPREYRGGAESYPARHNVPEE
ncbi:GlxA family transcriptional regulator [Burkholderia multivorans]|uniref:AraC family transcriptional regulator n=1 Tax=Burkholderia multivorans TaxID=87883 RepID=A0AB37APU3_9BURK|nr:helix-turn-helix domain-containing protein [Burkholderia multivorans]PRE45436.1 AraC family transcriptional regulator [Burkholderia multivorans]PRE52124.1 AraC family transcriptional regulator [Burkholderia multivorans]